MKNPYEPPKSDVTTTNNTTTSSRFVWKVYFFIFLCAQIISIVDSSNNIISGDYELIDFTEVIIYPFVLIAFFGYSFKMKIFNQAIWKLLFPVFIICDLTSLYIFITTDTELFQDMILFSITMLIILILLMIQYMLLYFYSFTDRETWEN